jgi:hypothetical protein
VISDRGSARSRHASLRDRPVDPMTLNGSRRVDWPAVAYAAVDGSVSTKACITAARIRASSMGTRRPVRSPRASTTSLRLGARYGLGLGNRRSGIGLRYWRDRIGHGRTRVGHRHLCRAGMVRPSREHESLRVHVGADSRRPAVLLALVADREADLLAVHGGVQELVVEV